MVRGNRYLSEELLKLVQILEVEIKRLIVVGVLKGKSKESIQKVIFKVIDKETKDIKVYNKDLFILGLKGSAKHWYKQFNDRVSSLNMLVAIPSVKKKPPIDILERKAFYIKHGVPRIKDYEKRIKQAVRDIAERPLRSPSRRGKPLSMRNLAEMSVRYEKNMGDLDSLKNAGVRFVWISSHADASERCEPFQGRLYSLDGTRGTVDGISYIPIEVALAGTNHDGNGCISGYNCRHYLKAYQKGVKGPYEFEPGTVKKERAIDQKQRRMERSIVKMRTEALLIRDVDREQSNLLRDAAAQKYKEYVTFSQKNERAFYPWRTQIVRYK